MSYAEAQAAYEAGDLERARGLLDAVVAGEPSNAEASFALGACELGLGRPHQAEAAFRRALALDPRHVLAAERLATSLAQQGRAAEAEQAQAYVEQLRAPAQPEQQAQAQQAARQAPHDPYVGIRRPPRLRLGRGLFLIFAIALTVTAVAIVALGVRDLIGNFDDRSPYEQCMDTLGSKERCKGYPK